MKDWSPIGFKTSKERKIKRDTEGKMQTKSPYEKEVEMKPPTRCEVGFDRGPESDFPLTHTTPLNSVALVLFYTPRRESRIKLIFSTVA